MLHSGHAFTKNWVHLGHWNLQGDFCTLSITSSAFLWLKQVAGAIQKAWQDSTGPREERPPVHSAGPPVWGLLESWSSEPCIPETRTPHWMGRAWSAVQSCQTLGAAPSSAAPPRGSGYAVPTAWNRLRLAPSCCIFTCLILTPQVWAEMALTRRTRRVAFFLCAPKSSHSCFLVAIF